MHVSYLFIFLSLSTFAQTGPSIEVIPTPGKLEDFEHQFKGCPENSECDQVMGLQLNRWKNIIQKVKEDSVPKQKKIQALELFRSKYGIPTEFYTYQKSQLGFRPLLFDSSCKGHSSKQKDKKVLRGVAFVKNLNQKSATVWRDQTQIEVPVGELLIPQPVTVFYPSGEKTFYLPLDDQPLFVKNDEVVVLKEEDGFFYALKISAQGSWQIIQVDMSKLSQWEDKKQEVPCPKNIKEPTPKEFEVGFCKSIWNEETKQMVVMKIHRGCVI